MADEKNIHILNKKMKSLLLLFLIIFSIININAQNFGMSMAFSTNKVLGVDFFCGQNNNRFHFGYGYQFNGQKNKVVKEIGLNHGMTKIEDGNFFWLINLGYSRIIAQKLTVNPEVSFGVKNEFTSYDIFRDNEYSLINQSKTKTGIGLNLGYLMNKNLEPFIGYHTLKKLDFGLRFTFF